MQIDCELTTKVLTGFIADEVSKAGFEQVVLGLSGGIDSAVSCVLATHALGAKSVRAIMMPYKTSSQESVTDAQAVVKQLGVASEVVEITDAADGYFRSQSNMSPLRQGNAMARVRMIVLFDKSMEHRGLVLGTSNKTELLLGYGTLFGDMASAINPIGDLYKTDIFALARYLKVPESILKKKPTADLWAGQSDEAELGFTYAEVDALLQQLIDERQLPSKLIEEGYRAEFVHQIVRKVQSSQFKRRGPVICKVSPRSLTHDFHYLRDWGL